jgi:catechol 2,3-dioxygenase-like lactoylglutathione lyase family enzyme
MPRLYRVIVPVPDMEAADAFYGRVLDLPVDAVVPERHYYDCDGVILALVDPAGHGRKFRPNPDLVYFSVPDLEAAFDRAQQAGARDLEGDSLDDQGNAIATRPWGERSFYCLDPFGNPLCFVDETTLFTSSRDWPKG